MSSSYKLKKFLENIGEGFIPKKHDTEIQKHEICKEDPPDLVFAKKINESGGKFFYCTNSEKTEKILKKLMFYLKIDNLYCIEENIQDKLRKYQINFKNNNGKTSKAMITTCEYIIADQGKVLLSSKQMKNLSIQNLPNELIIISYASQIVLRINDAMRSITKKYKNKRPSNITTIGNAEQKNKNSKIGNKKNLNFIIIEDFK